MSLTRTSFDVPESPLRKPSRGSSSWSPSPWAGPLQAGQRAVPGRKRRSLGSYRINFGSVREIEVVMDLVGSKPRVALAQSFMCLPLTQPKGGRRLFVQAKLGLERPPSDGNSDCGNLVKSLHAPHVPRNYHNMSTPAWLRFIRSGVDTIMQV